MAKIRMNRAEATQIQEVADRLAERTNERFVFDRSRIEIVDEHEGDVQPSLSSPGGEVKFG
jgi:hypothetical protein